MHRIDQPEEHKVVLSMRRGKCRLWLQVCAHPCFSRIHLLTRRPDEGPPATGFGNLLRQHLTGTLLERMSQVEGDRVVMMEFLGRDRMLRPSRAKLVAELVGVGSNLIVVDPQNRVLGSLHGEDSGRRRIAPGVEYRPLPPPSAGAKGRQNRFLAVSGPGEEPLAMSRAIQNFYLELEARHEAEEKRGEFLSLLEKHLKGLRVRLGKLDSSRAEAQEAESVRKKGELLKIAFPHLRRGDDHVSVPDFFSEGAPEVTIELEPTMGPQANMDAYFKRYRKLKKSLAQVESRLATTRREIAVFEALASRAGAADNMDEIEALKEEAAAAGLAIPERGAVERKATARSGPRVFTSRDGMRILVARNQRQNHVLTFSTARGNDYWLHVRGSPGSHVIVRKPSGKDVPLDTLLDAAHLAMYYSKMRGGDFAEVVYTQRKNVRKIRGGELGHVSYADSATLQVRFSRKRLSRIMEAQRKTLNDV